MTLRVLDVYTCIYRRTPFVTATREHILQNSFGARWESAEIVCNEVQQEFSHSIDKALEEGFKELRALLGAEGGRGGEPRSLKVDTTAGRTVLMQPGGSTKLAEPRVVPSGADPNSFQVEMDSVRDAGWVASKIRAHHPTIDMAALIAAIQTASKTAQVRGADPKDRIKLQIKWGGEDFFRGVMKALFNLLAANDAALALTPVFDPVRLFILEGSGGSRTFGRWPVNGPVGLPQFGDFDHLIAVYSRSGAVYGFAQFFGLFYWIFKLADSHAGSDFCYAYQVDPLRQSSPAENRSPSVTAVSFPAFEEGHEQQDGAVRGYWQAQTNEFLRRHFARADRIEIEAAILDAWGSPDDRVLTQADIDQVRDALRKIVLKRLGYPVD